MVSTGQLEMKITEYLVLINCPPFFPNLWNVHDSTLNDEGRTNYSIEG